MIVVNKRYHIPTQNDVYIGRPSIFGNPYTYKPSQFVFIHCPVVQLDTPEDCMRAYALWLWRQIDGE